MKVKELIAGYGEIRISEKWTGVRVMIIRLKGPDD